MLQASSSSRWPALMLAIVLAASALCYAAQQSGPSFGRDFYQVWMFAVVRDNAPLNNLYAPADRDQLGQFAMMVADQPQTSDRFREAARYAQKTASHHFNANCTPAMLATFVLFADEDYDAAWHKFSLISLGCYLLGMVLLCQVARLDLTTTALAVAAFVWWFGPMADDITDGNVNRLQLGMTGLVLWLTVRCKGSIAHVVAGALAVWLAAFKPNLALLPVLILVVSAAQHRYRRLIAQLGGSVLAGIAGVVLPGILYSNSASWPQWFARIKSVHTEPLGVDRGNMATARLIRHLTDWDVSIVLAIVLTVLTAGFILSTARKSRRLAGEDQIDSNLNLFAAGMAALIALMSSQLAWPHYFVLLIPLILLAIGPVNITSQLARVMIRLLTVLAILIIAMRPLASIMPSVLAVQMSILLASAMIIIAIVAMIMLHRGVYEKS